MNKAQIVQQLEKFETTNPFSNIEISEDVQKYIKKGICCSHCGSFQIESVKSYIHCGCGMYEPRELAIVRTICEYGVLHAKEDLRATAVHRFFDGQVSRSYLVNLLNKHFTKIGNNRGSRYVNMRLPFPQIYKQFNFDKCRYLKLMQY